jgi:hypothetical protein
MREPDFHTAALTVRVARGREVTGRPSTQKQPLWVAIRNLKTFGLAELLFVVADPKIKPASALVFLHRLTRGGYLTVVRKASPGRGAIWRLKPRMDTGPRPPVQRSIRATVLWDQNLKAFVGETPVAKEVSP